MLHLCIFDSHSKCDVNTIYSAAVEGLQQRWMNFVEEYSQKLVPTKKKYIKKFTLTVLGTFLMCNQETTV